jgi:methylated-DNA-[protein]-cysteine S-methyltransferase
MSYIDIQYYQHQEAEFLLGSYEEQLVVMGSRYRKKRETVDKRIQKGCRAEYREKDNALLQETRKQLDEYFNAERQTFDLPLLQVGTDFQKRVWQALEEIPYGTTVSYADIAKSIGKQSAVRAVANAVGANAIGIIIPCHRVIGSDGSLTGYAGGVALKKSLLELESLESKEQ